MTFEERQKLGTHIVHIGVYYNRQLSKEVVSMMIDDLVDLDFKRIFDAYNEYRKNPANRVFPLPAQIRAIAAPTASNDHLAKEAASRIPQAISKFGWCNGQEARAFIGELGWRIVERFGGWPYVCENHGVTISPDTFYAQARDLAKSTLELKEAGIDNQPIAIESGKVFNAIEGLAQLKSLDVKK